VLNGGVSTFLAFVLLGGSDSYIFLTFFKVNITKNMPSCLAYGIGLELPFHTMKAYRRRVIISLILNLNIRWR
jgi:hypothetical protein